MSVETEKKEAGSAEVLISVQNLSKSFGDNLSRQVHATHIRQLHVQISRRSPAALVVDILQAQLVDPYLTRLYAACQVAHTNHHSLYLAQRRVTHNGNTVVGIVGVVVIELRRIAGRSCCTGLVAGFLQLGKQGKKSFEKRRT